MDISAQQAHQGGGQGDCWGKERRNQTAFWCDLQGLYMLLVPTTSVGYDAEKEERAEQEAKMAKISAIEEAKERWQSESRIKVNQSSL